MTAAFLLAAIAGALAGIVTGILTTKLKIPPLLAGILTMIGLYSVNLHVMGKANVALLRVDTVFSYAAGMGLTSDMAMMAVGLVGRDARGRDPILVLRHGARHGYSRHRLQLADGSRARRQYQFNDRSRSFDFQRSCCFVGALVCQANGFADVGMGTGTIVIGLASVIIGEVLFGTRSFKNCLISVILGSIVYRLVIAIVLQLGMPPNDLKLFTAILVAIALSMPLISRKVARTQERSLI